MTKPIISVQGLGKEFEIRHAYGGDPASLVSHSDNWGSRVWKKMLANKNAKLSGAVEKFWALEDVNFEIQKGEKIGIIGKNGAGKSTLLKILSRVLSPTTGRALIHGRVASLLEVGTGFHPELSGRENIFLNGAILGMSRNEIKRKFDDIVSFSEIERFLDTPVKRYSSGMYVRLAFAVAAYLDSEILFLDEVLAVGDAYFQSKCLGKMGDITRQGRTILFISHNLQAVRQLCNRAMLIEDGRLQMFEDTDVVIDHYLRGRPSDSEGKPISVRISQLPEDPAMRLTNICLTQKGEEVGALVSSGDPLEIAISYQVLRRTLGLRVFVDVCDQEGLLLFRSFHDEQSDGISTTEIGTYESKVIIPANLLAPMSYCLYVHSGIYNVRWCWHERDLKIQFKVEATGLYNKAYLGDAFRGKLAPVLSWCTTRKSE